VNIVSKSFAGTLAVATLALCSLEATNAQASAILTGNFGADNYAYVYISTSASSLGTLIGQASGWNPATAITATNLADGTYFLNVEVINGDPGSQYSAGGFLGDFSLNGGTFSTGSTRLLTGTSGWLSGYNDANYNAVPQAWVTPTGSPLSEGANGISPWGNISGISSSANWIWASDSRSSDGIAAEGNQCAACTIDFQAKITVPEPAGWTVMLVGLAALGAAVGIRRKQVTQG
jgi:MYXO-CTERM domain-containing protein